MKQWKWGTDISSSTWNEFLKEHRKYSHLDQMEGVDPVKVEPELTWKKIDSNKALIPIKTSYTFKALRKF